jgi:hypothetical protein
VSPCHRPISFSDLEGPLSLSISEHISSSSSSPRRCTPRRAPNVVSSALRRLLRRTRAFPSRSAGEGILQDPHRALAAAFSLVCCSVALVCTGSRFVMWSRFRGSVYFDDGRGMGGRFWDVGGWRGLMR